MPATIRVPLPKRMRKLPVDHRGYPVPWFVQWVHGSGDDLTHARPGEGRPEFRIMDGEKFVRAIMEKRCWVCGDPLGRHMAFVIGPMCAVNRVSAEPPCHLDCATFSAQACPFLSVPKMRRREENLPPERESAGIAIKRNPGVALVWATQKGKWRRFNDGKGGVLFNIGEPDYTLWYAEGRAASREEVMESIESGLPILREMAEQEGDRAVAELDQQTEAAMKYVPVAV